MNDLYSMVAIRRANIHGLVDPAGRGRWRSRLAWHYGTVQVALSELVLPGSPDRIVT